MREVAGPSRDILYHHILIYRAIERQQPDQARQAMYNHINQTLQGLEAGDHKEKR
jgi:GntR family transcriptional repressor for pyruvate dehydrogenase complex